jgi:hypothetical protein
MDRLQGEAKKFDFTSLSGAIHTGHDAIRCLHVKKQGENTSTLLVTRWGGLTVFQTIELNAGKISNPDVLLPNKIHTFTRKLGCLQKKLTNGRFFSPITGINLILYRERCWFNPRSFGGIKKNYRPDESRPPKPESFLDGDILFRYFLLPIKTRHKILQELRVSHDSIVEFFITSNNFKTHV